MLKLSLQWTACLFLFPFLLLQGVLIRRTAMRLPEASGPRQDGDQESLMAVLGDSVVVGVGVDNTSEALPAQLAAALGRAQDREYGWRAIGANGDRLQDVLLHIPKLKFLDQKPALIVINVGVNDVSKLTSLMRWQLQLTSVVAQVKEDFDVPLVFLGLPPMHLFPLLPQPLRFALGVRAKMLDLSLKKIADALPGVHYVGTELPSSPEFIAVDGYHPSASGVAEWTDSLAQQMDFLTPVTHNENP